MSEQSHDHFPDDDQFFRTLTNEARLRHYWYQRGRRDPREPPPTPPPRHWYDDDPRPGMGPEHVRSTPSTHIRSTANDIPASDAATYGNDTIRTDASYPGVPPSMQIPPRPTLPIRGSAPPSSNAATYGNDAVRSSVLGPEVPSWAHIPLQSASWTRDSSSSNAATYGNDTVRSSVLGPEVPFWAYIPLQSTSLMRDSSSSNAATYGNDTDRGSTLHPGVQLPTQLPPRQTPPTPHSASDGLASNHPVRMQSHRTQDWVRSLSSNSSGNTTLPSYSPPPLYDEPVASEQPFSHPRYLRIGTPQVLPPGYKSVDPFAGRQHPVSNPRRECDNPYEIGRPRGGPRDEPPKVPSGAKPSDVLLPRVEIRVPTNCGYPPTTDATSSPYNGTHSHGGTSSSFDDDSSLWETHDRPSVKTVVTSKRKPQKAFVRPVDGKRRGTLGRLLDGLTGSGPDVFVVNKPAQKTLRLYDPDEDQWSKWIPADRDDGESRGRRQVVDLPWTERGGHEIYNFETRRYEPCRQGRRPRCPRRRRDGDRQRSPSPPPKVVRLSSPVTDHYQPAEPYYPRPRQSTANATSIPYYKYLPE